MDNAIQRRLNADRLLDNLRTRGPRAPRTIETDPPNGLTARDARIAMQQLIDEGRACLDDQLHLAAV